MARGPRIRARPALETLETRVVLSTVTVTRAADDLNAGSLRYAITQVNLGRFDTIDFAFTDPFAHTIAPASALPPISRPVTLNSTFQPVTLDGTSAGPNTNGLRLDFGSDGSIVQGLVIENFGSVGLEVASTHNTIIKNHLGTDETGSVAKPNLYGIILQPTAKNNRIGGAFAGNVISGNLHDGILVQGEGPSRLSNNTIVGNMLGLNAAGTAAVPNGFNGILL